MYHSGGVWYIDNGEHYACMCRGKGNLFIFLSICYEPKNALKNKVFKRKKGGSTIYQPIYWELTQENVFKSITLHLLVI